MNDRENLSDKFFLMT